jgi:hypothetical protein
VGAHPTAHRYLNLLETGCLITRLRPLATNSTAALVKAPKKLRQLAERGKLHRVGFLYVRFGVLTLF